MRTTQSDLDSQSSQNRNRTRDTQQIRGVSVVSDDTACKGVPQEEYIGQEFPSLSICLSSYLSNLKQTVCPFQE